MKKLLTHYQLEMPIILVKRLIKFSYRSEDFLNWYVKGQDLNNQKDLNKIKLDKKSIGLLIFCYYFWIGYILSAISLISVNLLVSVGGLIISPFLIGGVIYVVAYVANKIQELFRSKTDK